MVLLSLGVRVCYGKYCPGQVSTPNLRPSSGVDTATVVVSDPRPAVANDDRLIFILPLSSALSSALLWLSLTNRVQIQTHMYVNYLIYCVFMYLLAGGGWSSEARVSVFPGDS